MNRHAAIRNFAALVCLLLCALPAAARQEAKRFLTEYRMDREAVTIPFERVRGQILVTGDADDHKGLTFLFDTGATVPVLDTSLGYKGYSLGDVKFHEAEGESRAEKVWVNSFRLAAEGQNVEVRNCAALITDMGQVSRALGRRVHGILGMAFLAGYVTEINYTKNELKFYNSNRYTVSERKPDNRRTFLFDLTPLDPRNRAGVLMMNGKLHPQYEFKFLLDTGFDGYVSVPKTQAEETGLFGPNVPRVSAVYYSLTRQFRSHKVRAGFLTLGEVNLSGRVAQVDERGDGRANPFGIVGNRFLQNYRVTLDPLRLKLWLERVTARDEPDPAETPTLGLTLRVEGPSVRIEGVRRDSPAHAAGLRPGDRIVSVNGFATDNVGLAGTLRLLTAKNEVALHLARGADPNLGASGEAYSRTLSPSSPLDWKKAD